MFLSTAADVFESLQLWASNHCEREKGYSIKAEPPSLSVTTQVWQ